MIIAIILLSLTFVSGKNLNWRVNIVMPFSYSEVWRSVKIKDIRCPRVHKSQSDNIHYLGFREQIDILSNEHYTTSVYGHVCHKISYTIQCYMGFFGSETIVKKISYPSISKTECKEAADNFFPKGETSIPYFPAKKCSWMNTAENSKTFITITRQTAHYNSQTRKLEDEIFLSGECTELYCETKRTNMMWYVDEESSPGCPTYIKEGATVHKRGSKISSIAFDHYPEVELEDLCATSFCDTKGYLTPYGIFFKIKFQNSEIIKSCPKDAKVMMVTQDSQNLNKAIDIDRIRIRESCIESIILASISSTITTSFFNKLHPTSPGGDYMYRIKNNILERAKAFYKRITNLYFLENSSSLVWTIEGKNYTYSSAVKDNETYRYFNGISYSKGKLFIPQIDYSKDLMAEEAMTIKVLEEAKHPTVKFLERAVEEPDIFLTGSKTYDVKGKFIRWAEKVKMAIWFPILFAFICFLICFCFLCFSERFFNLICKCTKRTRDNFDIPMSPPLYNSLLNDNIRAAYVDTFV